MYEMAGLMASALLAGDRWRSRLPDLVNQGPLRAWLSQRDLPPVAKSFHRLWRERRKEAAK